MKRMMDKIILAVLPFVASLLIRFLALTMRFTYVNFDHYRKRLSEGGQIILAFWHGRLLMMPYSYPGRGITILVSQHRDGELVARTVKSFGITSVRGSSTRGWLGGVKGLLKSVGAGRDIAITPDGPLGPPFRAQTGIVEIASRTSLPIIPMAFGASKKKPSEAGMHSSCPIPFQRGSLSAETPWW